jgi:hypothetical protein
MRSLVIIATAVLCLAAPAHFGHLYEPGEAGGPVYRRR